jgi:hypothetical protein
MTQINAQSLTIKKGQCLTQALMDLVVAQKMEMSGGKITLAKWNATIDKLAEIQQARASEGKKSIFTGGTDRKDYRGSFVVHPNQKIDFTKEEMASLYGAMGVSFKKAEASTTQEESEETEEQQPADKPAAVQKDIGKMSVEELRTELSKYDYDENIDTRTKLDFTNPEHKALVDSVIASSDTQLIHQLVSNNEMDYDSYEKIKKFALSSKVKDQVVKSNGGKEHTAQFAIFAGLLGNSSNDKIVSDIIKLGIPEVVENAAYQGKGTFAEIMEVIDTPEFKEKVNADEKYSHVFGSVYDSLAKYKSSTDEEVNALLDKASSRLMVLCSVVIDNENLSAKTQQRIFDAILGLPKGQRQDAAQWLAYYPLKGTEEERKAMFDKCRALNNRKVNESLFNGDNHDIIKKYYPNHRLVKRDDTFDQILIKFYKENFPKGKMKDKEYNQKIAYLVGCIPKAYKRKTIFPGDIVELSAPEKNNVDSYLSTWESLKLWYNRW